MTDPTQGFQPLFPTLWDPAESTAPKPTDFIDPGILYPRLPSALRSYQSKYTPNNQFQQQLSTPVYNALQAYDQQRVQQGKAPLSDEQTAKVATAAQQNRAITPEPQPNLLEAAGQDLTNLVTSIPKLPFQLWGEAEKATHLPKLMGDIQRKYQGAEQLGHYLQLPLVNLVPGTFTASNLLTGNAQELWHHPLFTALDVLPYASKAASATKVAKATEAVNVAEAEAKTAALGLPVTPKTPNPIKAVMLNRLDPSGNLTRNFLGQAVDTTFDLAKRTGPGKFVADAWSPTSREISRAVNQTNLELRQAVSPTGPETTNPTAQLMRDLKSLETRHPDITQVDRRVVTQGLSDPLNNPTTFTPAQQAYADDLRVLNERTRMLAQQSALGDELADREWFGSQEVFSKTQAQKLDRIDASVQSYQDRLNARHKAITNLKQYLDREQQPTIDYSVRGQTVTVANPHYTPELDSIIDQVRTAQRTDPQAKLAADLLKRREYSKFYTQLNRMYGKAKYNQFGLDDAAFEKVGDTLTNMDDQMKIVRENNGITEKNFASHQAKAERLKRGIVPARFGEVSINQLKKRLTQYVTDNFVDDPRFQDYLAFIDQGNYASLLDDTGMDRDFWSLRREVNQTMAGLKEAGVDPVFLHHVSPESARALDFPAVLDKRITPSSLKTRTLDITPYIPDMQVAMSHQALEFLNRQYADVLVDRIQKMWGVPLTDLRRQYLPYIQDAMQRNPGMDVNIAIERAMKNDGWVKFDPESFAPWRKKTGGLAERDTMMVPGEIKRNMDRMHKPPGLVAAIDPVMNLFRTSVLALSPRWLVNNVIGGAMMLLAETADPIRTFRFLKQARDMVKSGELHNIPGISEGNLNFTSDEVKQLTRTLSGEEKLSAIQRNAAGKWIRNVWDDVQAQKASGLVRDKFGKLVQGSYALNTWFDDFYRAIAYLTGEDRALTKGLTAQEAERQGVALSRKIMQNWDEITPIERTVLRYIFPFYGFMQHIARYVMRYPFDHPWRTAILGSFARNELEDMGTGLPQRFLSMAFIGNMDEKGNQRAVTLNGANPFAAVSDMYTLGGLLGSTNPLISSFAESLGIDPTTGTAELYPNVRYNPETGRLEPQQQNYLATLLGNVVPGYAAINDTVFDNAEWNKLLKTNPDAAARKLQAQLGIPLFQREVNIPQEIMKAELQRIDAEGKAKSEMLRTGNYELADQYPGLYSYLGKIQELDQQGQLDQYREPSGTQVPNPLQAVWNSYVGQAQLTPAAVSSGAGGVSGWLARSGGL